MLNPGTIAITHANAAEIVHDAHAAAGCALDTVKGFAVAHCTTIGTTGMDGARRIRMHHEAQCTTCVIVLTLNGNFVCSGKTRRTAIGTGFMVNAFRTFAHAAAELAGGMVMFRAVTQGTASLAVFMPGEFLVAHAAANLTAIVNHFSLAVAYCIAIAALGMNDAGYAIALASAERAYTAAAAQIAFHMDDAGFAIAVASADRTADCINAVSGTDKSTEFASVMDDAGGTVAETAALQTAAFTATEIAGIIMIGYREGFAVILG